ncbi:MAG: T9SS type A sorting domain-containing protein [Ignavibacteria bacterium]
MNKNILILTLIIFSICSDITHSQTLQWKALPNSPSSTSRFEDMYFINENTGWIVHYDGRVFRTTNAGQNWTLSQNIPLNRSVGFFNSQNGLIGTLDSARPLYRTTNNGANWIQITNIADPKPKGICGISIINENEAVACGRYFNDARAFKTTDKGISWINIFNDTSKARTLIDTYFWNADTGLIVGGYNTSAYYNGVAVVLRTTNGGITWTTVHKTNRIGEWCWKICFYTPLKGVISIERGQGFSYYLKTSNGGLNWTEMPFRVYDEEGIGFINDNTGWIGGWTGPTYETTNGGTNWHLAGWGENVNRFRFFSDTLGYAVGDRVYKYSRGTVGINQISSEVPETFKLHQNYPNPFNPNTIINYELQVTSDLVSLKIFDVLGNEVDELVNEKQNAGSYSVEFDGSNLPSGVYFYKLEAGDFIETKRMILLK